jgi:hypothetical protein
MQIQTHNTAFYAWSENNYGEGVTKMLCFRESSCRTRPATLWFTLTAHAPITARRPLRYRLLFFYHETPTVHSAGFDLTPWSGSGFWFLFDADPDQDFFFMRMRIRILIRRRFWSDFSLDADPDPAFLYRSGSEQSGNVINISINFSIRTKY